MMSEPTYADQVVSWIEGLMREEEDHAEGYTD